MKTGVIYARYSSNVQTEQSIEGQVRAIKEYAKENNIQIVGSYIDRATTGTNDNRVNFQKMLKKASQKAWDYVLVYKLDRFSRNKYEMAIHKKTLRNNGIQLISVTENIPDTPEGIILESILEGMAEYYSLDISQKTKRGKRESRLKGNYDGGAIAYGYKIVKIDGEYKAAICEENAAVVRRIFKEYLSGKVVQKIVDGLNADRIRNQRGNPFSICTVTGILHNERYIGRCKYRDDKVYTNIFPRLIPDEWFELAQRFLKENYRGGNSTKNPFILKGKLVCGCCGGKMRSNSATTPAGKTFRYYSCVNKLKSKELCTKTSIHQKELEEIVVSTVKETFSSPHHIDTIVEIIYKINEDQIKDNIELAKLITEKEECQGAIDNLMTAYEAGIITNLINERLSVLQNQLADINKKIEKRDLVMTSTISKEEIRKHLQDILSLDPLLIIKLLVKEILLFEDRIEIYLNYTKTTEQYIGLHSPIRIFSKKYSFINCQNNTKHLETEASIFI